MKHVATIITALFILLPAGSWALTGREIMEKNDRLKKGKTWVQESVLLIVKGASKIKKEFSGTSKRYGKKTRKRINFKYPTRMQFLVWDEPGSDSRQWVKLTSGKVRKIASSEKNKPWVNSHFYNEDISERNLDDYSYRLAGEGDVGGIKCYKVESRKKRGTKVYSKGVIYVAQSDFVIRRIDLYERGRMTKVIRFLKIEKISGIYTPRKVEMKRTDGRGKSILYIKSVKYNLPVSNSLLKRESF
jgi:hypothetical protein